MKGILEKYKNQFSQVNPETLLPFVQGLAIWDIDDDPELKQKDKVDPKKTIVTGTDISNEMAFRLLQECNIDHVIQSGRSDFFYEILASSMMLKAPDKFIKNPLPFFLKTVQEGSLDALLQRKVKYAFTSTKNKGQIVEAIDKFLTDEKRTAVFTETVLTLVNELMLNAFFDAPITPKGVHTNINMNRANIVNYPKGVTGYIHLAHDNDRLFVACEDPYGSISFSKLKKRLYEIYVQFDTSLSGMGARLIIDNSSGVYFLKQNFVKTLVCCSFPLGIGLRKSLKVRKSFHFCNY